MGDVIGHGSFDWRSADCCGSHFIGGPIRGLPDDHGQHDPHRQKQCDNKSVSDDGFHVGYLKLKKKD